jgi:hypothetical protein
MNGDLIPVAPDLPHPLGRAGVNHDPRNRDYRALVKPPPRAVNPYKSWATREVFDQGNSPRCTCEAAIGLMRTSPNASHFTGRRDYDDPGERQAAYLSWQQYDPWPKPHDGSSTDAPFQGLRAAGEITGWRWLFGETEAREYVTWYGPIVVGTVWLDGMFYPDGNGFLPVTGGVAGGHAYRIVQYNPRLDAYRVVNSWGRGWGQSGRAWIGAADLAALLDQEGDAVTLG